jgi:hypothetical protein
MSVSRCSWVRICVLFIAVFCLSCPSPGAQGSPEIEIQIGQALHYPGELAVPLSVYMRNHVDTVAAFEFMFLMDRPNVAGFCDKIDSVGTLVAGWEYLDVGLLGGDGWICKVIGLAEYTAPYDHRGIPPQDGLIPLFNLLLFVPDYPDLMFGDTAFVQFCHTLDCFSMASPDGRSLGVDTAVVLDSAYYHCTQWQDTLCLAWERVLPSQPWDSVAVDTMVVPFLDTLAVTWNTGSVCVHPVCGDIDGSVDGLTTMDDLTVLIDNLFISLTPLRWPEVANVDGSADDLVTMSDLTVMIDNLFISLEPMDCNLE